MKASNSAIQTFKQCRRLYQLKYRYGFEPVQTAAALRRGLSYHEGVENVLKAWISTDRIPIDDGLPEDPKIAAMVKAFCIYAIPKLEHYGVKVNDVEQWFEYRTAHHTVIGRVDGVTTGGAVIEHKTTSGLIDGDYWRRLEFDEQIPTYMLARGCNRIYYTVCATPSIRQKKSETDDEFFNRCLDWYKLETDLKINVLELRRPQEELKEFAEEQDAVLTEIEQCKLFYRNPGNCSKWGRLCEYASICKNCDPEREYIGFKRRETYEEAGQVKDGGGESKNVLLPATADEENA